MFEVDNQDHEDQRRELLTLLKATTVITTYPWVVIGFCIIIRFPLCPPTPWQIRHQSPDCKILSTRYISTFTTLYNIHRRLDGNPLHCDCHFNWFFQWSQWANLNSTIRVSGSCYSPPRIANTTLTSIISQNSSTCGK